MQLIGLRDPRAEGLVKVGGNVNGFLVILSTKGELDHVGVGGIVKSTSIGDFFFVET